MAEQKTMLVFGASGRCGLLTVKSALRDGWSVVAFVRNPARFPLTLFDQEVKVFEGDLNNEADVAAAVRSCKPTAIVDASSTLPIGHASGQPASNADRTIFVHAVVTTLAAEGWLDSCVLVIVGSLLFPEPGGVIKSCYLRCLACCLRCWMGDIMEKMDKFMSWLFEDTNPAFRFIYARLGLMAENPHQGTLVPQPTLDNIQHGTASYCDVADALVQLAGDKGKIWHRQPLILNYES